MGRDGIQRPRKRTEMPLAPCTHTLPHRVETFFLSKELLKIKEKKKRHSSRKQAEDMKKQTNHEEPINVLKKGFNYSELKTKHQNSVEYQGRACPPFRVKKFF